MPSWICCDCITFIGRKAIYTEHKASTDSGVVVYSSYEIVVLLYWNWWDESKFNTNSGHV